MSQRSTQSTVDTSRAAINSAQPVYHDPTWTSRILLPMAGLLCIIYMVLCYFFFFEKDLVIEFFSSLNLLEAERIEAKSDNLIIGFTTIFLTAIVTLTMEWQLQLKSFSSVVLTRKKFYDYEPGWFALACLTASIICGVTIPIFFLRSLLGIEWLYIEDGPMEYGTAAGYAIAAVLCAVTLVKCYRSNVGNRLLRGLLFAMVASFAFVSLEEISWGQRLFGVETPESLAKINTQNEINLHNLFTDYFNTAYFYMGIVFFLAFCTTFIIQLKQYPRVQANWLPHPLLLLLAAEITCFCFHLEANELIEPISAAFVILFSIQLAYLVKSLKR